MAINKIEKRQSVVTTVTQDQEDRVNKLDTNAARIRFLHGCGYTTNQISKILDIRYQWVRNVLTTPLKRG